jgi:hypothetical protein
MRAVIFGTKLKKGTKTRKRDSRYQSHIYKDRGGHLVDLSKARAAQSQDHKAQKDH